MTSGDDEFGGPARLKPSTAATAHDGLPLPSGLTVGQLSGGELAAQLVALEIPGAAYANGRQRNAENYAKFIDGIRSKAADDAVAAWLTSKRN